jgi:mannose-6-phosphate isomerase-like protein (cupin superfamily)
MPGRAAPVRGAKASGACHCRGVDKVNLADKLARIDDHWNPRIVAELNGQHVKLVKLSGPFVWHKHDHEDELFFVVRGLLRMELRDRVVEVGPGELIVIPRGVEHRPVAEAEVEVMLFEPATTLNTGDAAGDARTRTTLERI